MKKEKVILKNSFKLLKKAIKLNILVYINNEELLKVFDNYVVVGYRSYKEKGCNKWRELDEKDEYKGELDINMAASPWKNFKIVKGNEKVYINIDEYDLKKIK